MVKLLIILSICFIPVIILGQKIDNTVSYRNISSSKFIRFSYENDYFSETDKYYTQGMNLEFSSPSLSKLLFYYILLKLNESHLKRGIALEHLGFTPTSISDPKIRYGDMPFSTSLFLKTYVISLDTAKKLRLSSIVSTGIIGPAAGGEEIQKGIHSALGNVQPLGWENQIQNDLILNYQIDIEKNILTHNYFELNTKGGLMGGTLYDNLSAGLVFIAGIKENYFKSLNLSNQKYQLIIYTEPGVMLIGYNATLQGGFFNKTNRYVIESKDIKRIVLRNTAGITIKIRKLSLEYFQSITTEEFTNQGRHRWGGLRLGVLF